MGIEEYQNQIFVADTLSFTKKLPNNSIDTILFSPPYWSLRDYKIEPVIFGGDSNCEHGFNSIKKPKVGGFAPETANVGNNKKIERTDSYSGICSKCGAWRGQLGQELTWHDYISHMVEISKELKRVMKEGGSMWVNIGDTFWGGGGAIGIPYDWESISTENMGDKYPTTGKPVTKNACGCGVCVNKQKIGMPHRLRFALNDIGFISRDDVIWFKPNHMPGSQRDRFTVSYEFLFRFVKNNNKKTWWYNQKKRDWKDTPQEGEDWAGYHYYFDLDSVRKPHLTNEGRPGGLVRTRELNYNSKYNSDEYAKWYFDKREKKGWHGHEDDAQMGFGQQKRGHKMENMPHPYGKTPEDMIEIEMKEEAERAGYSEHSASRLTTGLHAKHRRGIKVGHELGKTPSDIYHGKFEEEAETFNSPRAREGREGYEPKFYHELGGNPGDFWSINPRANTLAWCDTCKTVVHDPKCPTCGSKTTQHFAGFPEDLIRDPIIATTPKDGIVYDPFIGSGTSAIVAKKLGRKYIGCDLNPAYVEITKWRLKTIPERLEKFS